MTKRLMFVVGVVLILIGIALVFGSVVSLST
jgi:hypothetical protein